MEKVSGKRGPSVESLREGFVIQQGLKVRTGKTSVVYWDALPQWTGGRDGRKRDGCAAATPPTQFGSEKARGRSYLRLL